MTTTMDIDWTETCEKCLGRMEQRRVKVNGETRFVLQCVRCRFHKELP